MSNVRILFIGEIVGKYGVFTVKTMLPKVRKEYAPDFVIANGEATTGGFGIGQTHAAYLRKLGLDVITTGECVYYKKDMVGFLRKSSFVLRPANYPPSNPGLGWKIYEKDEHRIGVINLLGQSEFNRVHLRNPFHFLQELVEKMSSQTKIIVLDFHAATTAEKYAMFYHADGKLSAVFGTHQRVLTADAQILPGGTAVICNAGRTGSSLSVVGLDPVIEINKFLTQIPEYSRDCSKELEFQGVIVDIDDEGKAVAIQTIKLPCREVPNDGEGEDNKD